MDINKIIKQYKKERKKWKKAGKPMRSDDEMKEVYEICRECPFFKKSGSLMPGYDMCDICKCNLHESHHFMNKIAWATTKCPDKPPKWTPTAPQD